jgi:hypothetical protein
LTASLNNQPINISFHFHSSHYLFLFLILYLIKVLTELYPSNGTISDVKNVVFWDVMMCGSCENRRFGGTYRLHHQSDKNWQARYNVAVTSN